MALTIIAPNPVNNAHLASVVAVMETMGAPRIRCVYSEQHGVYVALEGSHRLAAAEILGLDPIIVRMTGKNRMTCKSIGYDDMGRLDGKCVSAVAIAQDMIERGGCSGATYRVEA